VELLHHQICWSSFPGLVEKEPSFFYDECWTPDWLTMLYAQKRHVTNKPNPPKGTFSVQNNRPEGYANYLVGRFYIACEADTIAVQRPPGQRRKRRAGRGQGQQVASSQGLEETMGKGEGAGDGGSTTAACSESGGGTDQGSSTAQTEAAAQDGGSRGGEGLEVPADAAGAAGAEDGEEGEEVDACWEEGYGSWWAGSFGAWGESSGSGSTWGMEPPWPGGDSAVWEQEAYDASWWPRAQSDEWGRRRKDAGKGRSDNGTTLRWKPRSVEACDLSGEGSSVGRSAGDDGGA